MPAEIKLALDRASVRTIDQDGHLHVSVANISKAAVNDYTGAEINEVDPTLRLVPTKMYKLLRDPEELAAAAPSFNGKQLLDLHKPQHASTHDHDLTVGNVNNVRFEDPYLKAELHVWEAGAIAAIQSGVQQELSAGYRYKPDMTPGEYQGKKFDGVMRSIVGNHVALVETGRAGPDVIIGDSAPKLEKIPMALVRKSVMAIGALRPMLLPKLAQDKKPADLTKALRTAFDGISSKEFKSQLPVIKGRLQTGLKGALASDDDTDMTSLLEDIQDMLDEVSDAIDDVAEAAPGAAPAVAAPAIDTDADCEGRVKEILSAAGVSDEVIAQVVAAMKPEVDAAMDAEEDPPAEGSKPPMAQKDGEVAVVPASHTVPAGALTKTAMDAAIGKAKTQAKNEALDHLKAIRAAEKAVRPHIGEIDGLAMDSAADIYRLALKQAGRTPQTNDVAALAEMVEMLPDPRSPVDRAPRVAMDSSAKAKRSEMFPNANRLSA